jgi:predicted HAD superfamily Cof-like phosphohydrolase
VSNFQKVKDFHRVFSRTSDPETPTIPNEDSVELRYKLITEEYKEVIEELGYVWGKEPIVLRDPNFKINIPKLAKELADLEYVVDGTAAVFGIPHDEVFAEVHSSNMSKLDKDGNVVRREDGKVLKSELYRPADVEKVFKDNGF